MNDMELTSVNIGAVRALNNGKRTEETGIFKEPVARARVTALGLAGDAVCDKESHGGVDQAVYVYGTADYEWWEGELGRALAPGTFGENLTIGGLASSDFNIGDRLRVGEVSLEVTAPRIPCSTLAARMADPSFAKRFRFAERPGLYCRVIAEGDVRAGDQVTVERYAGETIGLIEMFRDFYVKDLDEGTIRRHLAAPIAIRDRIDLERKLAARAAETEHNPL